MTLTEIKERVRRPQVGQAGDPFPVGRPHYAAPFLGREREDRIYRNTLRAMNSTEPAVPWSEVEKELFDN